MKRRTEDRLVLLGAIGVAGLTLLVPLAVLVFVVVQMFNAADRGDMPHVVAWGVLFLALTLALTRVDISGRSKS